MNLLIEREPVYLDVLKKQAEVPDRETVVADLRMVDAKLDEARRAVLRGRGRAWFGRPTTDVRELEKKVDALEARRTELRAQLTETEWKEEVIAEAIPQARAHATQLVGERMVAETARLAVAINTKVEELRVLQQEADALAELMDRQFQAPTYSHHRRLGGPLRAKGPLMGVLRYWSREQRGTLAERLTQWRELCRLCGVTLS